jgi:hypothetical protein
VLCGLGRRAGLIEARPDRRDGLERNVAVVEVASQIP